MAMRERHGTGDSELVGFASCYKKKMSSQAIKSKLFWLIVILCQQVTKQNIWMRTQVHHPSRLTCFAFLPTTRGGSMWGGEGGTHNPAAAESFLDDNAGGDNDEV